MGSHFQPTSASAVCSGFWFFSAWPSFPWASLNLKQRQLPIQRLTRIFCMEATMDLDIMGATTATLTTATTERDLLTPSLFLLLMLMPKLKQTPVRILRTRSWLLWSWVLWPLWLSLLVWQEVC